MVEHPSPKRRAAGSSPVSPASTSRNRSQSQDAVAQQEETHRTSPSTSCTCAGRSSLFYVLQWSIDWIWGYFGTAPSEFTISLVSARGRDARRASSLYRSDKYYNLANEVASELKKVTWPTAKEVRTATMVVIVMAIISAIILGLFDFVWSNLTELVYG